MARKGINSTGVGGADLLTSSFPLYAFTKFPENVDGAVKYQTADCVSVPERPEESATALNFTGFPSKRFSVHPPVSPSLNPPCDKGPDFNFSQCLEE
jgi:hypothetical protein